MSNAKGPLCTNLAKLLFILWLYQLRVLLSKNITGTGWAFMTSYGNFV